MFELTCVQKREDQVKDALFGLFNANSSGSNNRSDQSAFTAMFAFRDHENFRNVVVRVANVPTLSV